VSIELANSTKIIKINWLIIVIANLVVWSTQYDANAAGEPIKMGVKVWAPDFFLYLAQEKGFFHKNDVNVELTLVQDYQQILSEYFEGQFDGMIPVYSDAIYQNSQGLNSKVVYAMDFSNTGDVIIGTKNSGNNFTFADLNGKKIGVEGINTFSHLFVLKALQEIGLKEGDVEIVSIPAQNVTLEMDKGTIVAGHIYQPYLTEALNKGYKVIFAAGNIPGIITDVISFRSNIIDERPKDVQAVIKSIIEAQRYYLNNKEDALKIMSMKSGIGEQEISDGLASVTLPSLEENFNISINIKSNDSSSLYVSGKYISEFFLERGQISDYPDFNEILAPQFVVSLHGSGTK
jgi:NitT/TauT family transport system substrate-binding protein